MDDFLQMIYRIPIIVIFLIIFIRSMGRKEMKQSTPLDLIYIVLLASIGWDLLLEDQFNLLHNIGVMFVLTLTIFLFEWLTYTFRSFAEFTQGKPKVIIHHGEWKKDIMERERISVRELESQLRSKGVFDVSEVEVGILEVTGELTIKKWEE